MLRFQYRLMSLKRSDLGLPLSTLAKRRLVTADQLPQMEDDAVFDIAHYYSTLIDPLC